MQQDSAVFVGLDTSKMKISVALAEEGRQGEVRFLGDIDHTPEAVRRLVTKLAGKYGRLLFCYEAGPTGYGLQRQISALGHDCAVIAPSLIPKRPGERVKTNRRDAITLARLHRAGELTRIWVPDPGHEAVRELVRAREAAMADLRTKRQHLQSFLLREPSIMILCGRCPSSTPAGRSRQPRTNTRKCGDQPAHQSSLTVVLTALSPAPRNRCILASPFLTTVRPHPRPTSLTTNIRVHPR